VEGVSAYYSSNLFCNGILNAHFITNAGHCCPFSVSRFKHLQFEAVFENWSLSIRNTFLLLQWTFYSECQQFVLQMGISDFVIILLFFKTKHYFTCWLLCVNSLRQSSFACMCFGSDRFFIRCVCADAQIWCADLVSPV